MDQTHIRGPTGETRTPAGDGPSRLGGAAIADHRPSAARLRDLVQLARTGPAATAQRARMAFALAPRRSTSPGVVQRNAAGLTAWINTRGGTAGAGHNIVDAGIYVVVNDALEMTDAFWQDLSVNNAARLDDVLQGAVALHAANQVLAAVPLAMRTTITALQSTGGGRMRFRTALGPTPGVTSIVETYVVNRITPAYPGGLPAFIANMTVPDRWRLYDLANAGRQPADDDLAIAWAVAQGPATVSEFVNFTEYYHAEKVAREQGVAVRAAGMKDVEVAAGTHDVAPGDLRVALRGPILAERFLLSDLNRRLGRYFGQLRRRVPAPLSGPDVIAIRGFGAAFAAINVGSNAADLDAARILQAANGAAAEYAGRTPHYDALAQAELKGEDVTARLNALIVQERAVEEAALANALQVATAAAATAGVNIGGFWALAGAPQRQAAISLAATNNPIPFSSTDGAAYHALKHYADIRNTAEAAGAPGQEQQAYLASARETLRNPNQVIERVGQIYAQASFFFYRTVPAPAVGGATQNMMAIVVVTGAGDVMIATYMRG